MQAEGVLRDTLLLLLLCLAASPLFANHRDTLGVGGRTYFIENKGQWKDPFLFKAQMHNAALFLEDGCFTVALRESVQPHDHDHHFHHQVSQRMHAYKVYFAGCNASVDISASDIDQDGGYDNYYYGHDPSRWVSRLPHYGTVYYSNLYPGIDMDVRVAKNAIKTNFYISPSANPSDIVLRYDGADKLYMSNGNLIIRTSVGELVELAPYAYQETDTGRHEIAARYRIKGDEVSFVLDDYDSKIPLVLDPTLIFSTYTGSTSDNWGTTATYDFQKNAYTAGLVFGTGYPVSVGAYDGTYNGNADVGIFKFDTSGSVRMYATYLGGSLADMPHSMYVNAYDELVIFGTTGSADFPVTPGAYDTTFNGGDSLNFEGTSTISFAHGSDIFVSRFSSDGTELQASTYVGGSGNDGLNYFNYFQESNFLGGEAIYEGNDSLYFNYGDGARGELITDDLNNVYVGSTTCSYDFPVTEGCVRSYSPAPQTGVVFKIDYNLSNMIWATYLGGYNGKSAVYAIDVDSSYNLVACGGTTCNDFPTTPGAMQTNYAGGSADGFVCKISYHGDRLMYSTFFGSGAYDQLFFVRCGRHNEVFVYGQTKATGSTMIYNATYNVPGSGMLLARLLPDLSGRVWSTVFGTPLGRPNLSPTAFAADLCNRVYACGWGRDFVGQRYGWGDNLRGTYGMEVTADAVQSTTDGQDFYIMTIDENASHLDYATFFGELHSTTTGYYGGGFDHVDGGTSRFDKMATLYQSVCASCYQNDAFPTTSGAWSQHNLSNNCNNALFRINIHSDFAVAECVTPPVECAPYTVDFINTGRGDSFEWDFGDGATSTLHSPQHTYSEPGIYNVRLIAHIGPYGCRPSDTTTIRVWVLSTQEGQRIESVASCDGGPLQIGFPPMTGCSYQWLSGDVSDPTIANPYVTHGGEYILRISANANCFEVDTFSVRYIDLLDTLIVVSPTCPGGSDGRVIVVPDALSSDSVRYFWDGVEGDSILTGLSADGLVHSLLITGYGCSYETTFTLTDPPVLQYEVESKSVLCGDECDGWISISYDLPNYHVGDTTIGNLCEGVYTIHFADTAGCPYQESVEIIRDTSLRHMRVWADDTVFFLSESVQLHVTEVPGAMYQWQPYDNTIDHPTIANPIVTPIDTISVYSVTVTDTLGCTWHGSMMLHCTEVNCGRPNVFIPNAFSPNGDGVNDKLCFRGNFVIDFYLAIYTRWGEKVFETHDINDCWDGRYNGNWCMPGVYTYTCHLKCEAGFVNNLKGDITLIR